MKGPSAQRQVETKFTVLTVISDERRCSCHEMLKFINVIHEIQRHYWQEGLQLIAGFQLYLGKENELDMKMDQGERESEGQERESGERKGGKEKKGMSQKLAHSPACRLSVRYIIMLSVVTDHCRAGRNFNATFAILSGLGHGSVSRLKQTWDKLPAKYIKMFEVPNSLHNNDDFLLIYHDNVKSKECKFLILQSTRQ